MLKLKSYYKSFAKRYESPNNQMQCAGEVEVSVPDAAQAIRNSRYPNSHIIERASATTMIVRYTVANTLAAGYEYISGTAEELDELINTLKGFEAL
jgi:hypothetical protein